MGLALRSALVVRNGGASVRSWLRSASHWRLRPKTAVAMIVVGAAAFGGLWIFAGQRAETAQCVFPTSFIDLGEVPAGGGKYTVQVKNTGTAPLQLSGVTTNCSCATIIRAPEAIASGELDGVELELQVPPGPRNIRLTIESNDPEGAKSAVLACRGQSKPRLIPPRIEAHAVPNDRPYERLVGLEYPGGRTALAPSIERCNCESPLVEVRPGRNDPLAIRLAREGILSQIVGEQELSLKITPPPAPGIFETFCKLSVQSGKTKTELVLPISVDFVPGDLRPEFNPVIFSGTSLDELRGKERLIRIASAKSGADLVVRNVPRWLSAEILPGENGTSLLRLQIIGSPGSPTAGGTLQIVRPGDPGSPSPLRVAVFALRSSREPGS